ncbi:MAG: hypothetical protein HUU46_25135 [Candidatus Hydrogenedentes bacterium]|nr:hypothetical protein [Candidatus Hydrogenedentota bacterium]
MRIVVRGEIVKRVANLFPGVALDELEVRFPAKLEAAVMVRPVAFTHPRYSSILAVPAVPAPLAIRVLIESWTVFAHD